VRSTQIPLSCFTKKTKQKKKLRTRIKKYKSLKLTLIKIRSNQTQRNQIPAKEEEEMINKRKT
jgi:hypothetical protein